MSYLEKRTEFLMSCDWRFAFQKLDNEKAGELIKAIFALNIDQEDTDFHEDPMLDMLWGAVIKPYIIAKMEKYEEKCRTLAVNGGKGGNATANNRKDKSDNSDEDSKSQQMLANANDKTRLDKTEKIEKIDLTDRKAAGGQSSFPTLELIKQYCVENGLSVDAEEYYNKMESQEWKYKGEPIKDWKRHIKSWSKDQDLKKPPETKDTSPSSLPPEMQKKIKECIDNGIYWEALPDLELYEYVGYNERPFSTLTEHEKREFCKLDLEARKLCDKTYGTKFGFSVDDELDDFEKLYWTFCLRKECEDGENQRLLEED